MLVLLLLATASTLLAVKLFLPRLLSAALSGMGLRVVRSHFRLLHMKFLRVEMRAGMAWGATVDEVGLKVNSNFGSREGIFLLTLQGVRLRKEPPGAFDPGGGEDVVPERPRATRRDLGGAVDTVLDKLTRLVERFFLNNVAAAVSLEVRQVEYWAEESSSVLTAATISLGKVPGQARVRLRCVDARLRPRSWREDDRGGNPVAHSLRCPLLEVDFSPEGVFSEKVSVSAEAGNVVADWTGTGELELAMASFRAVRNSNSQEEEQQELQQQQQPWLLESSDVCLSREGVFSMDLGSVALMQADGGRVLSQLSKIRLNAKRRPPGFQPTSSSATSSSSSAIGNRFSVALESVTLLVEDGDAVSASSGLRVANVQLDKLSVVRKDVLAAEGEKDVFFLQKLSHDVDSQLNSNTEVVAVAADLNFADVSALRSLALKIRRNRRPATAQGVSKPKKKNAVVVRVRDVSARVQVGEKHKSVLSCRCDQVLSDSKWKEKTRKSKALLSDCVLRTESPRRVDVVEKIESVKVSLERGGTSGMSVQVILRGSLRVHWHPDLHLSLFESFRQLKNENAFSYAAEGLDEEKDPSRALRSFSLLVPELTASLHCDCTVASVVLSEAVLFLAPASRENYATAATISAGLESPSLAAATSRVLLLRSFMASYSAAPSDMRSGAGIRDLRLASNPCVNLSADSCSLEVPFQVDLHRPFLADVIGYFKWAKQLHVGDSRSRRTLRRATAMQEEFASPSSKSSKCLPDMLIYVRRISCKVEDDVFEVRLRENYRLMEDEFHESQKRRECLQRKIEELRQSHSSFLSSAKVEELYSTLKKRDAELYTKRARGLKAREAIEPLVDLSVTNFKLFVLSDPSMESVEAALAFMQESDGKTAVPRDLQLNTNIFRWVKGQAETISVTLRDFGFPLIKLQDLRAWGPVLLAEEEASDQEWYVQALPTAFPDGPWKLPRSMKSVKVYQDLNVSCQAFSASLGPCLDPVLGQVTISLSYLFGRRSRDPSPPLPWWDKIRFFVHGRSSVRIQGVALHFLTTMDPYNTGERVELTCRACNVVSSQLDEAAVDCRDLALRIRTRSEYEDCKPLHVPRLRLRLRLTWQSLGGANPRQHFAVRLTSHRQVSVTAGSAAAIKAKVDSYADFRSTGFEMAVQVKTVEEVERREGDSDSSDGDDEKGYVAMEMLSSTVKWVEELMRSSVLSSTSPPIRKGRLFGCDEGWKKKTLLRHLRRVRVETFSVHRLELNYWTSILHAEGVQARAEGGIAFQASYSSRARSAPRESLIRRPSIEWTNESSECSLSDAVIRLQQQQQQQHQQQQAAGEGGGGSPGGSSKVKKHFFLSIEKVQFKMQLKKNEHLRQPMPQYLFIVTGANCAWTIPTRDLAFSLYENWWRDQKLREQLSRDVLMTKSAEEHGQMEAARKTLDRPRPSRKGPDVRHLELSKVIIIISISISVFVQYT